MIAGLFSLKRRKIGLVGAKSERRGLINGEVSLQILGGSPGSEVRFRLLPSDSGSMPFRTADAARMPVKQYLRKLSRWNAKTQHKFRLIRAEHCHLSGPEGRRAYSYSGSQSVCADLKELSHFCDRFAGI